jgi:hypothetical protein
MKTNANFQKHPRLAAFIAGVAAPLIITTIGHVAGTWNNKLWFLFFTVALVYGFIGTMVWRGSLKSSVVPLLFAYFAIPFGVCVDVTVDWFVWHHDRNLFPFDMVFLFVLAFVPLCVGAAFGKMLRPSNTDAWQEPPRDG